jgi:hypothetical protein
VSGKVHRRLVEWPFRAARSVEHFNDELIAVDGQQQIAVPAQRLFEDSAVAYISARGGNVPPFVELGGVSVAG